MSHPSRVITASFAAALVASLTIPTGLVGCGKSTKDKSPSTEPKVAEGGKPGGSAAVPGPQGVDAKATPPAKAAARGPERAVYSLVDNRLSAHQTRGGGLLIPGGSAGFAKYIRFGNMMGGGKKAWDLRQTEGDIKVARLTGKNGTVFFPLTSEQAKHGSVRMRVFSKSAGPISVRVNDNKDLNASLTEGWQTVELTVPDGQLAEGENSLSFFNKPEQVGFAWLQIGGTIPVGDDGQVGFYDGTAKALTLPKGAGASWYAFVPAKAQLTGDLADGSCQVRVVATAEDGGTAEGTLTGLGSAVDLGPVAGKAVRLDLEGQGCEVAKLAGAGLVLPGAAPELKRAEPPKNVVFIIMDSLRADHIRAFNPKARAETPNWDKLAETSAVFQSNYVQGNESQVSHAAMWTSMYLAKHKSPNMKDVIPDKFTTIDEVAKKAGKFVAGVSANGYIRPKRGYGSAWDKYVNHIESSMGLKGVDILEKGISFVEPKKDQPFFLYLGLIDTHVTLRAKQPWLEKYAPGYKGRFFSTGFGDDGTGGVPKNLSDGEMDFVRALYDSNVSYQDDILGKVVAKLTEWGVLEQTMIIVTADHGDELWEDGRFGHGGSVRESLTHVPLLIHYPALLPAGAHTEGTDNIDIVPTMADALGVAQDPEWQGASLVPLAQGHGGYPTMSFTTKYELGHAGRIGHWKAMTKSAAAPSIYNLAADKDEQKDLYGTAHIGTRLLLDPMWIMRQWNVEWKKAQWGNAASVSSRFAADLGE